MRWRSIYIFLLVWSILPMPLFGDDAPIQVGFSATTLSNVDTNDAVVALKVWFDQILAAEGYNWKFETVVFQSIGDIDEALKNGKIDILTISTMEYLRLSEKYPFVDLLTSESSGKIQDEQFLLVHQDSPFKDIAELRGKKIIIDARYAGENPMMWLEVELARRGLPGPETFFSSLKRVKEKPSLAVLPVFFGQADACIVRQQGLDTMVEMNPQVGQKLRILMKSPPLLRGLTAFRSGFDPEKRKKVVDSSKKLDKTVKGQQVLTLFKVDNIMEMNPSALQTAIDLRQEHLKLLKR